MAKTFVLFFPGCQPHSPMILIKPACSLLLPISNFIPRYSRHLADLSLGRPPPSPLAHERPPPRAVANGPAGVVGGPARRAVSRRTVSVGASVGGGPVSALRSVTPPHVHCPLCPLQRCTCWPISVAIGAVVEAMSEIGAARVV